MKVFVVQLLTKNKPTVTSVIAQTFSNPILGYHSPPIHRTVNRNLVDYIDIAPKAPLTLLTRTVYTVFHKVVECHSVVVLSLFNFVRGGPFWGFLLRGLLAPRPSPTRLLLLRGKGERLRD